MNMHRDMRGAFPVAAIDTLSGPEQTLVKALRYGADEAHGMARIARMLEPRMGAQAAQAVQDALAELLATIARHGRRRLMRHKLACSCVSSDEAVFAHFVMLAATGEREDAMLVGALMVEGPLLLPFTEAARRAGLELLRADLARPRALFEREGATVH